MLSQHDCPVAVRLALVLDRRLRMGEGSASGVPWGTSSRDGRLGKAGGATIGLRKHAAVSVSTQITRGRDGL